MAQSAVIHEEFVYSGHNAVIHAVCYNRVQDCFVTCDDATLRLWQPTKTNSELRQVNLPPRTTNFIQAIEFVELRQTYVASALDGTLKIYDLELNEITSVFAGRGAIQSLVFDSVHNKLFSGGVDGCAAWQVRGKPLIDPESVLNPLYDLAAMPGFFHYATGLSKLQQQQLPAVAGTVSPLKRDSTAVITQRMSIVSVPKPVPAQTTSSKKRGLAWVQSVQLNSEQTRLYAHAKHRVDVYSTTDGHHIDTFTELIPQESGAITAFVLHEKTQYLVCGCINGYIYVLSVHPTSTVHIFKDHTMAVTALAVHLSSHLIISSSLDGTVRLWDLEARRQAHRLDIRQPVYAMGILTPRANPCRFYCRVRSAVQLFTIRSAAKEHLSSLSPISILQRVTFPTAATAKQHDGVIPGEKLSSTRQILLPSTKETEESGDDEDSSRPVGLSDKQWIVAAGTDRTIRLFTGRAANEAPSFTWIPEEHALDVGGFSLHPVGNKLFILLDSQSIVIVDIVKKPKDDDADDEAERPRRHRMIDMNAAPLSLLVPTASQSSAALQSHGPTKKTTRVLGSITADKSVASAPSGPIGLGAGGANAAANPAMRGAVRSICCCYYPPIFRAAAAVGGDATAQLKWFSRTFVNRRQQSKRDLKRLDELSSSTSTAASSAGSSGSASPTKPASLIQSDREWIVCGSEYGHLIFWHSGLTNSFQEAISLDAHDASIIALSASASSPLLVSLDASKRVHIWQFQPVFTLRQMVELNESPTCFMLSPVTEIVLTGYEDGSVVLMHVSDTLEQIETFASTEENHDAMVSAADFLDAKLIVLTASVDAVIKIWDHEKTLLRQIQIAMALTCACFMNDDGDVMAGVPTGIFMLCKDDLLPEKLPILHTNDEATASGTAAEDSPETKQKKLPFWLGGEHQATTAKGFDAGGVASPTNAAVEPASKAVNVSSSVKGKSLFRKKAGVSFEDDPVVPEAPPSPTGSPEVEKASETVEAELAERRTATDTDISSSGLQLGNGIAWKRRAPKEMLANNVNPLSSLNKPVAMLHPPVLRPIENSPRRTNETQGNQQRATPPATSRPLSSRTMFPGKDPDWREVIMPSSPFHMLKSRNESPRHRQIKPPSQSATIIAELKALAHSPKRLLSPSPSQRPPPTPPSPDDDSSLAIGLADGDRMPLQYCKNQAPVAPKAKTPRKLWNAIGGEDRRLIAVQRNLPSL